MKTKVCLVSADHDAIEWLVYQLMEYADVELSDWKSVRSEGLKKFDWVIFDISEPNPTEEGITVKIGGLPWIAGRGIARIGATSSSIAVPGLRVVRAEAQAPEYLQFMKEVRA